MKVNFLLKILRGQIYLVAFSLFLYSCKKEEKKYDATGTFEADEIIVSSEATGRILNLTIREGDTVSQGKIIGKIDPLSIELQKEQIEATITAINQKVNDAAPQISVLEQQIQAQRNQIAVLQQQQNVLEKERKRFENLVKAEAATPKQLDDISGQLDILKKQIQAAEGQISVLQKQISAQNAVVSIQNKGIMSEKLPLEKRRQQVEDMLAKTQIISPTSGTVLSKYANAGEITAAGKPLFKVADLSNLTLRAYVTGSQLSQIKINQVVKILVDNGEKDYKNTEGVITWISDKAEFTPKTIQTKDERATLVYATKIKVKNDGFLKIGMYGEVMFK